jgi:hypothetical protein
MKKYTRQELWQMYIGQCCVECADTIFPVDAPECYTDAQLRVMAGLDENPPCPFKVGDQLRGKYPTDDPTNILTVTKIDEKGCHYDSAPRPFIPRWGWSFAGGGTIFPNGYGGYEVLPSDKHENILTETGPGLAKLEAIEQTIDCHPNKDESAPTDLHEENARLLKEYAEREANEYRRRTISTFLEKQLAGALARTDPALQECEEDKKKWKHEFAELLELGARLTEDRAQLSKEYAEEQAATAEYERTLAVLRDELVRANVMLTECEAEKSRLKDNCGIECDRANNLGRRLEFILALRDRLARENEECKGALTNLLRHFDSWDGQPLTRWKHPEALKEDIHRAQAALAGVKGERK